MNRTHTTFIFALVICVAAFAIAAIAQKPRKEPPPPLPPPAAQVEICGNVVALDSQRDETAAFVLSQGCDNVTFVPVSTGYSLVFGTRVVVEN